MMFNTNRGRTVMNDTRGMIPLAGLFATIVMATYMVVQLHGQATTPAGDLSNAAIAEVHDAQGQIVLRGQFGANAEDDGNDVERKAKLEATGIDADASGEAEVEVSKDVSEPQEVEFSVRNLQPGSTVTFYVDNQSVGQATVDRRGRAALEVDIAAPGSSPTR